MPDLGPKCARLAGNVTNVLTEPKCTDFCSEKSPRCVTYQAYLAHFDPNLTTLIRM